MPAKDTSKSLFDHDDILMRSEQLGLIYDISQAGSAPLFQLKAMGRRFASMRRINVNNHGPKKSTFFD